MRMIRRAFGRASDRAMLRPHVKNTISSRSARYTARAGLILIVTVMLVGMAGCPVRPGPFPPIPNPGPSLDLNIRTWHDLDAIRDNLAGHHRLMNSLNATTPGYEEIAGPTADGGKGWNPLGNWDPYDHNLYLAFSGTFDGRGHVIEDLFIDRPDRSEVGLFGYVAEVATITNVVMVNVTVTGRSWVGGIVGGNAGTVSNSGSSGTVTGGGGGLIGNNTGIVTDSWSSASVTGSSRVGGLVGFNDGGNITRSHSAGDVTGNHIDAGGLVGANWGTIRASYSNSTVTGARCVGGLVGENARGGIVSDSYATGSVTGNDRVGGLSGANTATVENSYSTGSVTGDSMIGGLVGENGWAVSNSFWNTTTSGEVTSDGGTGITTAEMQTMATFTDRATEGLNEPWDIIAVGQGEVNPIYTWNIVDGETFPLLSWQF